MREDANNDSDKSVKIYIRIFPLENPCESCATIDLEEKKIYARCTKGLRASVASQRYWCFEADEIFHESSQDDVYSISAKDLVDKVLDGNGCVLLGCGQTGTGKSFTLGGFRNHWQHRGLAPRLLSDLLAAKSSRRRINRIECSLSFVELRGNKIIDLLAQRIEPRNRSDERDLFKNLSVLVIRNEEEALRRLFEAETKRSVAIASTPGHASHLGSSVITFHVSNTSLITSWATARTAKIHIVEMAGTDSVRRNSWKRASDIASANLAKGQVERFFTIQRNRNGVPYNLVRGNSLLKILANELSCGAAIRLILHVKFTSDDLDMTVSTLRFGARIGGSRRLRIEESNPRILGALWRFQEEIDSLMEELDTNEALFRHDVLMRIFRARVEQLNQDIFYFLQRTLAGSLSTFPLSEALLNGLKELNEKSSAVDLDEKDFENLFESTTARSGSTTSSESSNSENVANELNDRRASKSSIRYSEEVEGEEEAEEKVGILCKSGITFGPTENDLLPFSFEQKRHSLDDFESREALRSRFKQLQRAMMKKTEEKTGPKKLRFGCGRSKKGQ